MSDIETSGNHYQFTKNIAQIFRTLDYNATLIAPCGTKIIAHERPTERGTWIKHVVVGWFIGPTLEHLKFYKVFVTETISERIYDVV